MMVMVAMKGGDRKKIGGEENLGRWRRGGETIARGGGILDGG